MNKHLSKEILDEHFHYFARSLLKFPEKYLPLMFHTQENIDRHVAYLCPLCVTNYIILRKQGLSATTEFSLDHFPPKSVGGTLKLLICKKCNNEAGSLYEAELTKKMNYEAIGDTTLGAEYKITSEIFGVEGKYTGFIKKVSNKEFAVDFAKKLKKSARFLKEWLNKPPTNSDWEMKVTIQRPDDKKVAKAICI